MPRGPSEQEEAPLAPKGEGVCLVGNYCWGAVGADCERMEQGQSRHSRPLAAQSVVPFGTSHGEVFKKMIKIVVPTKRKRLADLV